MNNKWLKEISEEKDFIRMSAELKKNIMKSLPNHMYLVKYSRGYFYSSGFVKNLETNKYAYFSLPDTRFDNEWHNNILVRKAKNDEDYIGGINYFCKINDLIEMLIRIAG